jgi:hypothetical protein
MSTCIQNFNMHVNKKSVNMQAHAFQYAFQIITCMPIKIVCQHAAPLPDEAKPEWSVGPRP